MAHQTLTPRVARATDHARETARDTVHEASPGLIWLGRCGLAAKGAVYVLIGVAATRAALGTGDQTIDSHGAFGRIVEMPFGTWLLGVVALGLAGFTVWRTVQALLDTEHKGSEPKGLWVRGSYLLSAAIHATLTLAAVRLLIGAGDATSGEGAAQDSTARLMEQPFGGLRRVGGSFGHVARGATFAIMGLFLVLAAFRH